MAGIKMRALSTYRFSRSKTSI